MFQRRRYRNSKTVLLAAYTFSQLTPEVKSRVDAVAVRMLQGRLGSGVSRFEFESLFSPRARAACRAFAMASLDIQPALEGETWRLPKPRFLLVWTPYLATPILMGLDFRHGTAPTERATAELSAKGIDPACLEADQRIGKDGQRISGVH